MIGGLLRRSLFKLDWTMEGKTVFCGSLKKLFSNRDEYSLTIDIDKIYTAHLIYSYYVVGNTVSTFSTGSSGNSYCNSYDIVLSNYGVSTLYSISTPYSSNANNRDGGWGGDTDCIILTYSGSLITFTKGRDYSSLSDNDSGGQDIFLLIKEHNSVY